MTAIGGITIATTDIATAAGTDTRRTTDQASVMRPTQVPIITK